MTEHNAVDPLVTELLPRFSEAEGARPLLVELVADWRREAGDDPDADAIIDVLRDEMEEALAPLGAPGRMDHLRAEVLDRRLRVLSRRTWAAAQGLRAGTLGDEAARAEGRAVLAEVEALAPEVDAVRGEAKPSLRQALEDVMLEGLYLVEREAMSTRFMDLFGPGAP